MRIAAYNVENMFERPVAMNMPEMEEGRPALEDHAELNNLIAKENYSGQRQDPDAGDHGEPPGAPPESR